MSARDTTPAATAVQVEIYRRMAPSRRCALAVQMSTSARAIALAGIRSRHPEYSEGDARHALFRLLVGDELFARAWPAAPRLAP